MSTIVDIEICDGCGDCMEVCPTESITIIDGKAHINPEDCIDCEACIETCPNKAITMVEE